MGVIKTVEVPQIQYIEKCIDVPVIKTVEQLIEIPRVEYQDVEGETTYVPVDYGVVRQMAPQQFTSERVVGPDLETTVTSVMQAPPTTSFVQPMTSIAQPVATSFVQQAPMTTMAAPTTSYVQPQMTTMAAPLTMTGGSIVMGAPTMGGSVGVPPMGGSVI